MNTGNRNEHDPIVLTHDLTKSYNRVDAVKSLDLVVPRHSIYGFLGPNGAGKTTTMKMLLGLIQPSAGSGTVFGLDIEQDSPTIRARIGYLPQDPRFYEHMTARETLRFAIRFFFSGPKADIERRIEETLELVGLTDKADRPIKGFSGGERQRLGIAQAQIHEPELLILDEPAAALDPLGRRDVLKILNGFRATTTVFYSTHILDDVQRVSDAVCILNDGKIAAQGPIEQLLGDSAGPTFTVEIEGDADRARTSLLSQTWVEDVILSQESESATLRVSVTDARTAEAQLQRVLLADDELVIRHFIQEKADLEDFFVQLIEGDTDNVE